MDSLSRLGKKCEPTGNNGDSNKKVEYLVDQPLCLLNKHFIIEMNAFFCYLSIHLRISSIYKVKPIIHDWPDY